MIRDAISTAKGEKIVVKKQTTFEQVSCSGSF
jgi:hypothetical protein